MATAALTVLKENKKKELKNAKGEAYVMHNVEVKSSTKGRTFSAVMFTPPGQELETGKEKTYEIEQSKFNKDEFVIKEVKAAKAPYSGAKGFVRNTDVDVWRMALDAAVVVAAGQDVAAMLAVADKIAAHVKSRI